MVKYFLKHKYIRSAFVSQILLPNYIFYTGEQAYFRIFPRIFEGWLSYLQFPTGSIYFDH